jgi:hypothetical protein
VQKERSNDALGGWLRLAYGSTAGAVVAAVLGYALSTFASVLGMGLITSVETISFHSDNRLFLYGSGLNFLAIHHIRLLGNGTGVSEGMHTSIIWPITVWALIPAVALIVGGYISSKLSNGRGAGRFASGAAVALPYAVLLSAASFLFVVPSGIRLPSLPISGWSFDPSLLPLVFKAPLIGTFLHGIVFGLIFAGLGAMGGLRRIWGALVSKGAYWPSWVRGAVAAFLVSKVIILLLAVLIAVGQGHRSSNTQWVTPNTMPGIAGMAHCFSCGATLRGSITTKAAMAGNPISESYRVGMLKGLDYDNNKKPLPNLAFLALIIPAVGMVLGGFLAAKSAAETRPKLELGVAFACAYALLLSALAPCYMLLINTMSSSGARTTLLISPSIAETFIFSFILAFIFGLIGVIIYRPNASS